ncbi:MAG: hypothetical protein GX657_07320 [Chloroflexi bacterium]|nr:hypothetical protein [Chloroflexota bacterium]
MIAVEVRLHFDDFAHGLGAEPLRAHSCEDGGLDEIINGCAVCQLDNVAALVEAELVTEIVEAARVGCYWNCGAATHVY